MDKGAQNPSLANYTSKIAIAMHKPTNTPEALENLGELIDTLNQELKLYAARSQPNMGYISKQNAHIQQLTHIYNCFDSLEYHEVWLRIEATMKYIEQQDPNTHGHNIKIHTKPNAKNFAFIPYNLFEEKI